MYVGDWVDLTQYLNVTEIMFLNRYVKNELRVMKFMEIVPLLSKNPLCMYSNEHGASCCFGRVSWKRSEDEIIQWSWGIEENHRGQQHTC